MALTGQLSDMSLAELIEFFCNQRKTGRLKVDYHRGHGVFFIKDGELVDAKVGALSGADAVYFALTLPNAAFDFSADFEPTRRTIKESWTQVVLEGLRRLDEGVSPKESEAFGNWSPSESDLALLMDRIERLDAGEPAAEASPSEKADEGKVASTQTDDLAPMSMMVESANGGGGRKKMVVFGALACVVLAAAVAAIPLARRMKTNRQPDAAAVPAPVVQTEATAAEGEGANASDASAEAAPAEEQAEGVAPAQADPAAAQAARREREARERAARERERKAEEAKKEADAQKPADAGGEAAKTPVVAAAASGPKAVRVLVAYDEQGRVTQASVAGATPGAEAYGATAVRIARGRRFPAGKAGGTVVTIPVN